MSMTRGEAIEELERLLRHWDDLENDKRCFWGYDEEAVALALSSLRPVSREQVEKVWKGCAWCNNEGKKPENWECSLLDDRGFSVVVGDEVVWTNAEFCPVCGKPLTDEAVQILIEKMEELKHGNTAD